MIADEVANPGRTGSAHDLRTMCAAGRADWAADRRARAQHAEPRPAGAGPLREVGSKVTRVRPLRRGAEPDEMDGSR
jgi:hypothetical protein